MKTGLSPFDQQKPRHLKFWIGLPPEFSNPAVTSLGNTVVRPTTIDNINGRSEL